MSDLICSLSQAMGKEILVAWREYSLFLGCLVDTQSIWLEQQVLKPWAPDSSSLLNHWLRWKASRLLILSLALGAMHLGTGILFFFFVRILFFLLLLLLFSYFTILYWFCHTSTCIRHGCTRIPHLEPPSHLPPHTIPLGHPSAPAPSFLYPASNLDWRFVSHMIPYMFQCHSPKSSPAPPTESKRLFYTSVSLLLSCIQGCRYHLSKFHIHVLVYCIGVFPSGLLHSVQ